MPYSKLALILSILLFSNCGPSQPTGIESLTIEEIRSQLDEILENGNNRVSESDRVSAILVRTMNWIERYPEILQAQVDLASSELDEIKNLISNWLEDPNRQGDNRISRMCDVWRSSSYSGSDRIEEALLAYETEVSTGYAVFTEGRVQALLADLESSLAPDSWAVFSTYIEEQEASYSGKISHSFFTLNVRRMQSFETMELHCE